MTESAQSFKQAFEILKNNAAQLEQQQEPDIDQLMEIVNQSMQAYSVCKQRIEAVQQALDATFQSD